MTTSIELDRWEDGVRQYLLHASLHDKRNPTQMAMSALRADPHEETQYQTLSAYLSPIADYLKGVGVVGAEADPFADDHGGGQQKPFVDEVTPYIISIRGFPDCNLIRHLGQKFSISPDALLGHLPYPPTFRVRPLLSCQRHMPDVLMISVGFYSDLQLNDSNTDEQLAVDKRTVQHNKYLFENNVWGPEQCHSVNFHGSQFFSVEQKTSFLVHKINGQTWSGIVLNNSGTEDSSSAWCLDIKGASARFLPLKLSGNLPLHPIVSQDERNTWQNLSQRRPDPCLSRVHQGRKMPKRERRLCLQDPRLFAADLLTTSAMSWKLFFNLLHSQPHSSLKDPATKADQLSRTKGVLERGRLYFRDVIAFLEHRNKLDWPTCPDASDKAVVEGVITGLRQDFKDLDNEVASLCRSCSESIGLEMNMISILDSKKSIEQAERVQKLTFLAYLFIPMTFISGIFGMNMKEINNANPSLWLYFAITIPVAIFFALISMWQGVRDMISRVKLALRRTFVGRRGDWAIESDKLP